MCGGGGLIAIAHAAATLQLGALLGTPWGSSLAMASLFVGLAMLTTLAMAAGTMSTWALVAATITGAAVSLAWPHMPRAMPHVFGDIDDQLAWSPLIAGLAATYVGATYACLSTRRDVAAGLEGVRRRLRPSRTSTSWALSLLIAALAAGVLDASVLWLAEHTLVDPIDVRMVPTGVLPSHRLALLIAVVAATVLAMSAALSSVGPIIAAASLIILPATYASILQLFTLGHSATRESLRAFTLGSPVLGVWGTVLIVCALAASLSRRRGPSSRTWGS